MLSMLLAGLLLAATTTDIPAACTAKIATMPDFCQTDKAGNFDQGGRVFCGPVAVSNSLVWLSQNGFPKLLPPAERDISAGHGDDPTGGVPLRDSQKAAQIELIRTLGSPDFMGTEGRGGTTAVRLMRGLQKYVNDRGYSIDHLEYRGWSKASKSFKPSDEKPSLEWMKQYISSSGGAVWLNIGWYKFNPTTKGFQRTGGHWITLVGYGANDDGEPDHSVLIIHDPSRRSGPGIVTHYVHVVEIPAGKLIHNIDKTHTADASGRLQVADGMVVKQGSDAAVIDGAVVAVVTK
ncbi:MAG: hypothetical protein IT427_00120 [Pirellulales bacterium]|nr:hypothetical protein [Pirellulales bacterium]